jgi:hypothetical protein
MNNCSYTRPMGNLHINRIIILKLPLRNKCEGLD